MLHKVIVTLAAAAGISFGGLMVTPTPVSAYYPGYCHDHPYAPACLAGHMAPYVHHNYNDHYDHHHHNNHNDHHQHHDHNHDHDHHHDHNHHH